MNELFGGVVYAGIDTDKHRYPIGKLIKYIIMWHQTGTTKQSQV